MRRYSLAAILIGLVCTASAPAHAGDVPDLAGTNATAWFVFNDEFQPPPSGPGPVTFDKRFPYVDNAAARRAGVQPTYRIADLTNPILQPWAREQMRKANEEVLNGKIPYVPRERCWPAGVPAYVLEPPFNITVFIETLKEILIVHQQDQQTRHIQMNVPH